MASKIKAMEIKDNELLLTLPAGGEDNINPNLLMEAFYEQTGKDYVCSDVTRLMILDSEMNEFV